MRRLNFNLEPARGSMPGTMRLLQVKCTILCSLLHTCLASATPEQHKLNLYYNLCCTKPVPLYKVQVVIENKPSISDPEGSTILNDLVLKGAGNVTKIRTAKMLKFTVEDQNQDAAAEAVRKICSDLRIYNPLVSVITVSASG